MVATAGLILLAPSWADWLQARGSPRPLAEAVAVAAAAFVVTMPVLVAVTGTVSLVAIGANLLVAAVIAPLTVIGVPLRARPRSGCRREGGSRTSPRRDCGGCSSSRAGRRRCPVPRSRCPLAPSGSIGGLVVAVGVLGLRSRRLRAVAAAIGVGLAVVLIPARVDPPGWPPHEWSLVACDVGQGDGLVLATGEGGAVVVDVGPDRSGLPECLRRLGIQRVDLLVLTHSHVDHIGGLAAVLMRNPLPPWRSGRCPDLPRCSRHLPHGRRRARPTGRAYARATGCNTPTSPCRHWRHYCHRPPRAPMRTRQPTISPSSSPRTRRPAGYRSPGMSRSRGRRLLRSGVDLRADVLKVPHHGSRTTSPVFLAAVQPRFPVISVGADNAFGHPAPEVLTALDRLGGWSPARISTVTSRPPAPASGPAWCCRTRAEDRAVSTPSPLHLGLGDEEFLVEQAISTVIAEARAATTVPDELPVDRLRTGFLLAKSLDDGDGSVEEQAALFDV